MADADGGGPARDDESRLLLGIAVVGTMTVIGGQFVVSPVLPEVIETFGLTPSTAGIGLTLLWAAVALAQYPGGRLVDAWTPKTVLVSAMGVAAVGMGLVLIAPTFELFVAGLVVFGVGTGALWPAIVAALSRSFASRRARAFSIHEVAINVGGIAAGGAAIGAIALGSWRLAFVPVLGLLIATAAVTHRRYDEPYRFGPVRLDLVRTLGQLLGSRRAVSMLAVFTLLSVAWQGILSFLPTFLRAERGFGPTMASQAFTGLFVAGIAAALLVAPKGDRYGPIRLGGAVLVLGVVGLGLLVGTASVAGAVAGILLFGFGGTAVWPLMISALVDWLPEDRVGGGYGAYSTVFTTLGSLGPAVVGVVADVASFEVAFAGLGGCLLLAAGLLTWLARAQSS